MAAFDMNDPLSVVSPGGVGFDINCGVRLLRTNLFQKDIEPIKEQLAQVCLILFYISDLLLPFCQHFVCFKVDDVNVVFLLSKDIM